MLGFFLLWPLNVFAKGQYLSLEQALAEHLAISEKVKAHYLWLNGEQKKLASDILQRPFRRARVKYYQQGDKHLWQINQIGKELPITFMVVTAKDKIQAIDIMQFRESRGDEIRSPAFRQQFSQLSLNKNHTLSHSVDGISGATYSVRAMKKVAKLALIFEQWLVISNNGKTKNIPSD